MERMETLFNFILIRPPEAKDPDADGIPLAASPVALAGIRQGLTRIDSATALSTAATRILADPKALAAVTADPLAQKGAVYAAQLRTITTVAQARAAAASIFGTALDKVV